MNFIVLIPNGVSADKEDADVISIVLIAPASTYLLPSGEATESVNARAECAETPFTRTAAV